MYRFEIESFFKNKQLDNTFVVSSDCLPEKFKLPVGIVVNLSPSHDEGTHWVAIFIDDGGNGSYFCSLGMKPKVLNILRFLRMKCKIIHFNYNQIQSTRATFCGQYSAVFIYCALKYNIGLSEFASHFSPNTTLNDLFIQRVFGRLTKFSN